MAPDNDLVALIANELFTGTPLALDAGPAAPAASSVPTVGDAPLEAAATAAPAAPALGSTPPPPTDAASVPAVGSGSFLSNVPYELDLQLFAVPEPEPAAAAQPSPPLGEGELLNLGLGSLELGGLSLPGEEGSRFYFLPSSEPPQAEPESDTVDVLAVRRDFPALHQKVNGKQLVWLDNAATTHKPQSVIDAVSRFYERDNSNIHRGAHTLAARATNAFEAARQKVQFFLGAGSTEEIIFTRGATESVNLVAQTYGRANLGPGDEVLVSELEHHSNIVPWQFICQEKGAKLRVIPIDDEGQLRLDEYEKLLSPRVKLVAVAHVSNVLGTVLPIPLITQLAHQHGAKVLVDGAQGAPHLPVNVQAFDADFYVVAGHKLFGPTGIGVLYGKRELLEAMPPWQGGGSMIQSVSFEETVFSPLPAKFEAGTPHIAGAVGLGAAIDYLDRLGMERVAAYEEGLMAYGSAALASIPGLRQIGTAPGKVGALAFVVPGKRPEDIGRALDREGIAVRAGHHCAQPALRHFGLDAAVRPSLSLYNTAAEVDILVAALHKIIG